MPLGRQSYIKQHDLAMRYVIMSLAVRAVVRNYLQVVNRILYGVAEICGFILKNLLYYLQ